VRALGALLAEDHDAEIWPTITACVARLLRVSTPQRLMQGPERLDEAVTQCVAQLLIIEAVRERVVPRAHTLPPKAVSILSESLQRSFEFALSFNEGYEHRVGLQKAGFMKDLHVTPGLLKQEREAVSVWAELLCVVGRPELGSAVRAAIRALLAREALVEATSEEGEKGGRVSEAERQAASYVPILVALLFRLKDLPDASFALLVLGGPGVPGAYLDLVHLVASPDRSLRRELGVLLARCEIFLQELDAV